MPDVHSDPKPVKRIRDSSVYDEFHLYNWTCVACSWENRTVEAHHVLSRAQGGDDVMDNLVPLCRSCHRAYHNGNRAPRRMIARFLRSEAGSEHSSYLIGKLGNDGFGAEAFVQRLER